MKINASQIVVIVLLAVAALVLFIVLGGGEGGSREAGVEVDRDDAFLEEVRQLQESVAPDEKESLAALPPVDGDQTLVPVVDIGFDEIDLGVISNSETANASIVIKNSGKAPLHIRDIKTSCMCTQGHLDEDKRTILPGDEAVVAVTLNPFRVTGFESDKVLTFYTNDPANPTPSVTVNAKIDPEFSIEPGEMAFGEVDRGESPTASVRIRQLIDTPFEVTGVNTRGGNPDAPVNTDFDLRYEKLPESEWQSPGKAEWDIIATLKPSVPPGEMQLFIFLLTDLPRVPNLPIKVTGTITSALTIDPAYPRPLTLKKGSGPNDVETAVVTITAENPVEIVNTDYNMEALVVTPRVGGNVQEAHLDVGLAPTAKSGPLQEEVRFTVRSGGKDRQQKVLVRAYVPAGFGS